VPRPTRRSSFQSLRESTRIKVNQGVSSSQRHRAIGVGYGSHSASQGSAKLRPTESTSLALARCAKRKSRLVMLTGTQGIVLFLAILSSLGLTRVKDFFLMALTLAPEPVPMRQCSSWRGSSSRRSVDQGDGLGLTGCKLGPGELACLAAWGRAGCSPRKLYWLPHTKRGGPGEIPAFFFLPATASAGLPGSNYFRAQELRSSTCQMTWLRVLVSLRSCWRRFQKRIPA
jgi:hypothetical protein